MNDNQKMLLRKLRRITYPIILLTLLDIGIRFTNDSPEESDSPLSGFLFWVNTLITVAVLLLVIFLLFSLIQHYFLKGPAKPEVSHPAAQAELLLKIVPNNQKLGNFLLLLVAFGFAVVFNVLLIEPRRLIDSDQLERVTLFEKVLFGVFYLIAHFLLIVFGMRLLKEVPPVFIATELGFCYQPSGIGTGWILWSEIALAKESSIIRASNSMGPIEEIVWGIRLRDPERFQQQQFAPILQRYVQIGQPISQFQTEGAGDILMAPSDFGKSYDAVKALFLKYTNATGDWHKNLPGFSIQTFSKD